MKREASEFKYLKNEASEVFYLYKSFQFK